MTGFGTRVGGALAMTPPARGEARRVCRGRRLIPFVEQRLQIACFGRRCKKMCPPGQGMPGRVYQIDAGWMGGAASIGYTQLSFSQVEFGISVSPDIGVADPVKGSKIF